MAKFRSRWSRPANPRIPLVRDAFCRDTLKSVCELDEEHFGPLYDMPRVTVPQEGPENFYFFKDNGSNVLAVAHLDTVTDAAGRTATFVQTEAGEVVFSRALDDRLGAYIILHLLPALGITCDILLTVGEESGRSTARFFDTTKPYHWMIEFDRGGTDVVMYQYEDEECTALIEKSGAMVDFGSYSDIADLEHLEVKGFNWGVGYTQYHSERSHAFLEDTFMMVADFMNFHDDNAGTYLPHENPYADTALWTVDHDEQGEAFIAYDPLVSSIVDKLYGDPETDQLIQA